MGPPASCSVVARAGFGGGAGEGRGGAGRRGGAFFLESWGGSGGGGWLVWLVGWRMKRGRRGVIGGALGLDFLEVMRMGWDGDLGKRR